MKPMASRLAFLVLSPLVLALIAPAQCPLPTAFPDPTTYTLTPTQGGGTGYCWHNFGWTTGPADFFQTYFVDLTAVSASRLTELRITDAFAAGDIFTVEVTCPARLEKLTLSTSLVPKTAVTAVAYLPFTYYPTTVQNDPDAAWTHKYHSKLALWLLPGDIYTVKIKLKQSAINGSTVLNGGRGYIRAQYYVVDAYGNILDPNTGFPVPPGMTLAASTSLQLQSHAPAGIAQPALVPFDINGRLLSNTPRK